MERIRIYQDGEKVIVNVLGGEYKMIVVDAMEELKQWKYRLAFQKLNGDIDKKRSHRFFYADKIKKELKPLRIK